MLNYFYTIAILYSKGTNIVYMYIWFKIESQNCPISSGYQKSSTIQRRNDGTLLLLWTKKKLVSWVRLYLYDINNNPKLFFYYVGT